MVVSKLFRLLSFFGILSTLRIIVQSVYVKLKKFSKRTLGMDKSMCISAHM